MDIELCRDGLTLRGKLERATKDKSPIAIMFHGFGGDLGYEDDCFYSKLSKVIQSKGISVVRFDFNGHGKSDGKFENMNVFNEIEDGIAIIRYVSNLDFASDIYLIGHSQGGVVAGMLAGYYHDIVKKLVLLAPAATLKDDAIKGNCMGVKYDAEHIPEKVKLIPGKLEVGGHCYRIAQSLPIYEVTRQFKGPVLDIHGVNDNVVNKSASEKYKKELDNCELIMYDNLDHGLEGEDQVLVIENVKRFLLQG